MDDVSDVTEGPIEPGAAHPLRKDVPGWVRVASSLFALVTACGAAVAAFLGVVNYTGCFLGCGAPNRLVGAVQLGGAAALTGATFGALTLTVVGRWLPTRLVAASVTGGVGIMLVGAMLTHL